LTSLFSCSSRIHRNHSPVLIAVQPSISTIYCKTLNNLISTCYPYYMIARTEPRSVYAEPRSTCPDHLGEIPTLSESVAHHPRRPLATIGLSSLAATLTSLPASVANKRLTARLNPLDATLTKNTGVGIPAARLPRCSTFRRLDVPTILYPPKSLPLNLFADPHPLNLYATILYKNSGGAPVGVCGYSSHFGLP